MTTVRAPRAPRPVILTDSADLTDPLELLTDVLVIGGGPAATWSAIAAAEAGASVVLVDKGHCGSSGVAATSGVGHWLVAPEVARRDEEIGRRERAGAFLTDRTWTDATLDVAWDRTAELPGWGWERRGVRGANRLFGTGPADRAFNGPAPDYLRFLRGKVKKSGVVVLDHSPALELLVDAAGVVSGARGYQRQVGRAWAVSAGAVVLATGGTTWKSHSLGGDVNTGDGHLMGAEVGAHLSSMEFSNFYGMVPFGTSMDKNGFFVHASYWDHTGAPIEYADLHVSRAELLSASTQGTITAQFTQFTPDLWPQLRAAMPNFFMVTDKLGVNPFTERFPIDWVNEGTVRGTGGLHVLDRTGTVGVPGLYAAGDVAARDRIVGAATGAGGPNLSWAIASGTWSGTSAARFARGAGTAGHRHGLTPAALTRTGTIGLHRAGPGTDERAWRSVVAATQAELLPIAKSAFRSAASLTSTLTVLDRAWSAAPETLTGRGATEIRTREAAGMLAMGRWASRAALARTESRGMHTRTDHPDQDPHQTHRLLTGGLDEVWVAVDPELPVTGPQPVPALTGATS